MTTIADGIGPHVAPAGSAARRIWTLPSPPAHRADRGTAAAQAAGAGEASRFGDLGRLYEARGRGWAEAVKTRQLDQTLGRLSVKTVEIKTELQQVKLYPPYPVDEPRRAAAIREFNGLAAEIRRMDVVINGVGTSLTTLAPNASTDEAERAVSRLSRVGAGLDARRADLAASTAAPGAATAETESTEIATRLGDGDVDGISRRASELLRLIG